MVLTPSCRKGEQKHFSFECQSDSLPDTRKSNFKPWLLQFCHIKVILWNNTDLFTMLLFSSQSIRAIQLCFDFNSIANRVEATAQSWDMHSTAVIVVTPQQLSASPSQFKDFLEMPLCCVALGQYTGAHTIYTGRPPRMRGHFHWETDWDPLFPPQRKS